MNMHRIAAIGALYLLLAIATAGTKAPWSDEAWYATPGHNLVTHGTMETSLLDPGSTTWKGVRLNGIDRHTYWSTPLHFLATAVWYKIFGFCYLTFFEGFKTYTYLVHIVPLFTAVLAIFIVWCWRKRLLPLWVLASVVVGLAGIQVSRTALSVHADPYHRDYVPAMKFLQATAPASGIMGGAEMGWELGFDNKNVIDDILVGYHSGRRPDLIVIDDYRYRDHIEEMKTRDPAVYAYATELLKDQYQTVYRRNSYTIYARNHAD